MNFILIAAQPVAKPEAKDKPMEPLKEKLEVPFRQKHEKQTKPTDTAKSKPSTEIAAPPPIPPSKPTAPPAKPQSRQTKGQKNLEVLQNNEMADLYAYFLNLEAALASNVGSAAVQELRSAHPKLHFTQPVPDSASNAPINDVFFAFLFLLFRLYVPFFNTIDLLSPTESHQKGDVRDENRSHGEGR